MTRLPLYAFLLLAGIAAMGQTDTHCYDVGTDNVAHPRPCKHPVLHVTPPTVGPSTACPYANPADCGGSGTVHSETCVGCNWRKPESVDVPAIKETHEEEYGDRTWCNTVTSDGMGGSWSTAMACDPHAKHKVTRDTCADKSRILLTAEDGKRWCHKVQP